ncbi:MAG: hypothetical protein Q8858_15735 [Bacteroidota bacterium]|nr:hypothetical protein [Bacteroidota bacterium]
MNSPVYYAIKKGIVEHIKTKGVIEMKKQILVLMLSAAIFSISPAFAMEEDENGGILRRLAPQAPSMTDQQKEEFCSNLRKFPFYFKNFTFDQLVEAFNIWLHGKFSLQESDKKIPDFCSDEYGHHSYTSQKNRILSYNDAEKNIVYKVHFTTIDRFRLGHNKLIKIWGITNCSGLQEQETNTKYTLPSLLKAFFDEVRTNNIGDMTFSLDVDSSLCISFKMNASVLFNSMAS